MKNSLHVVTVVALLLAASFGLRNLVTPNASAMAASAAYTVPATGTGGPVPPPAMVRTSLPTPITSCTGTGGPVPPPCVVARAR